ncbi:MAG TPA: FkbM family methyltransferase, partial [Pseudonocardiaceae bacterium]|nr:FkbM family methyltransferase [Pseudonocardiaceae bacterium]
KHFYDLGWRGINIEPIAALADEFRRQRPGDVTLAVALGAHPGTATLHLVDNLSGLSTVDEVLAREYRDRDDLRVREVSVPVRTLADVLDEYPGPVDFLKIDVEAAERAVIEGADFTRHRPRVLVVEATEPGSPTPAYQDWEPLLVAAGYRCALFDGLNRFYAADDDTEAITVLAAPANVFDVFERVYVTEQRAALAELRVLHTAETGYLRRLEDSVREAQEGRAKDVEYLETLQNALREAHQEATKTRRYVTALENRITELEAGQADAAHHIAMLEQRLGHRRADR